MTLVRDELARKELEAVLSALPVGVVAIDRRDHACLINPAAAELLGLDPTRLPSGPLTELLSSAELQDAVASLIAHAGEDRSREVVATIDGKQRGLRLDIREPITSEASGIRWILTATVLSDAPNRRLADFVANASHELRTPLSIMKTATETLMESERLSAHDRRILEVLTKNVDRLEVLVRDLLDLNFVESPRLKVSRERFELKPLLNEIVAELRTRIDAKKITIRRNLQVAVLTADRKLLKVVLANLLDNAVKFSRAGSGGKIDLRSLRAGRNVILEVEDSGVGIPEDDVDRVFERFYQVDKSRHEGLPAGSGLGLAIVKHAMAGIGGGVELQSRLGEGTLLRLCIPQIPVAQAPA